MNDGILRQAIRIRIVMGKLIEEKMVIHEDMQVPIHPVVIGIISSFGDFLDYIIVEQTEIKGKDLVGEMLIEVMSELEQLGKEIERQEIEKANMEVRH